MSGVSREGMFLVNNLIFVVLTFTVLVGTVFPLIVEAFKGKQMSVGRPYFDAMAVPMGVVLLFLIGVGPALPWGKATRRDLVRSLVPPSLAGIVVAAIGLLAGIRNAWPGSSTMVRANDTTGRMPGFAPTAPSRPIAAISIPSPLSSTASIDSMPSTGK